MFVFCPLSCYNIFYKNAIEKGDFILQNIICIKRPRFVRWEFARARALDLSRRFLVPPIDPVQIIKECDWKILNFDFTDKDTDAGIIKMKNGKFAVFVNPYKKLLSPRRYRFTLAHEIGHVALNHYNTYNIDFLSEKEKAILDKEADEFAGELLVPKTMLKTIRVIDIGRLADAFQVSHDVMRIRLQRHNMIKTYKALR